MQNCLAKVPSTLSRFSCVWLFMIPWTVAHQALLSIGFFRQEHWSRLSFPPLGDLLDQGSNPRLLRLQNWQAGSLPLAPLGKPQKWRICCSLRLELRIFRLWDWCAAYCAKREDLGKVPDLNAFAQILNMLLGWCGGSLCGEAKSASVLHL